MLPPRDHVQQQSAVADPVECGRLAHGLGREGQSGAQGDQQAQPLGDRCQGRGGDPCIDAQRPGRHEHTREAKMISSHRDLAQISGARRPRADGGRQVALVTGRRQEPQEVDRATPSGHGQTTFLAHATGGLFFDVASRHR